MVLLKSSVFEDRNGKKNVHCSLTRFCEEGFNALRIFYGIGVFLVVRRVMS